MNTLSFYKKFSKVVFVSGAYRFWDKHGFVQQSLVRWLVKNGVAVEWYDGFSAPGYVPQVRITDPLLKVETLPSLRGRRLDFVDKLHAQRVVSFLEDRLKPKNGKRPLVWVWGSLDERVCEKLSYIDVFSVFDDPFLHAPLNPLCEKASLITAQNNDTVNRFRAVYPGKVRLFLPPMDLPKVQEASPYSLPAGFPKKIMSYFGAYFSQGYDLVRLKELVQLREDWGFLLVGRTDPEGKKLTEAIEAQNKNFVSLPWATDLNSLWAVTTVNLLLYRPDRVNSGAFPVKYLEGLHYGKPTVATRVAKTSSLEGWAPRVHTTEEILSAADSFVSRNADLKAAKEHFSQEMSPENYLDRVARFLEA